MPYARSKNLHVWFGVAGLVLLLDGAFSVLSIHRLIVNRSLAERSRLLMSRVEQVLSAAKDAETGQRGFIITGKEEYLEPYHWAVEALAAGLPQLHSLAAQERAEGALTGEYERLIRAGMEYAQKVIEVRREQGSQAAHELVLSNEGKAIMDRARVAARQILKREEAALAIRAAESERSEHRTLLMTAIAGVLNLVLLQELYRRTRIEARMVRRNAEELERQVAERTSDLREANAQLEAFTYTVSHDLRAPLRGIQGFAEAVEEDYAPQLGGEGADYLHRIVNAARRMERLIEDLLAYSRLSRAELRLAPVNLQSVVQDALVALQSQVHAADGAVSVEGPLPAVLAHGPTLAEVMQNLVANALKFVRPGERPRVGIRAERLGGKVRIWVEDLGIGIASEHFDRIFQVFERLHGQEAYPGTGIGLAIVKKAIERMGGACGVESQVAQGSRFWIVLPAAS